MELLATLQKIEGMVWGPVTLALLLGTGIYLTFGLRLLTLRRIGTAFRLLWAGRKDSDNKGDISPFNALMTALSATVGTGNIVGVAGAIAIGGPGAIFWMWLTALFGMATKYSEAVLAVKYREVDERGKHQGGPMYYIRNGLGKNWAWLAFLFALFGALAAFGIGNGVQASSVSENLSRLLITQHWASAEAADQIKLTTGIVLSIITALVLIGGINRIGRIAGKLVPFMAVLYVAGALIIILSHASEIPSAIGLIVADAFTGTAATGGFIGSSFMLAIQFGVARGVFSNEAGLGSAPIAHAAAQTRDPVQQGTIGMLGTFIDTIVICTITALVIILMNGWTQVDASSGEQLSKASMTFFSFAQGLPGLGEYIVTFGLVFFAYTTILGWSFYGERCAEYLLGVRVIIPYRILWVLMVFVGSISTIYQGSGVGPDNVSGADIAWSIAGILNGLMAIPNLIGLLLLSPMVFKLTRDHYAKP